MALYVAWHRKIISLAIIILIITADYPFARLMRAKTICCLGTTCAPRPASECGSEAMRSCVTILLIVTKHHKGACQDLCPLLSNEHSTTNTSRTSLPVGAKPSAQTQKGRGPNNTENISMGIYRQYAAKNMYKRYRYIYKGSGTVTEFC